MSPKKPVSILLDTNFLMIPIRFSVDIVLEIERVIDGAFTVAVTSSVVDELKRLKHQAKPSEVKEINFALDLAKKFPNVKDKCLAGEDVDKHLLRLATNEGYVIATTDNSLRKKLRKKGVPVVYLRKTSYLALDGMLID